MCIRDSRRIGSFVAMFSFANSVFIGLPVSKALFGDVAAPLALTYYFSNTSMFWAIGHTLMRRFGDGEAELPKKRSLWSAIPLPLATLVACGLLLLVRFKPPKFFMSACGYVGSIVTPLSLIYTGAIIMRMIRNGHVRWQKGYLAVCLGRFVICPALLLLASAPFGLPDLMQRVLFMQATMPVMSQTVTRALGARCRKRKAMSPVPPATSSTAQPARLGGLRAATNPSFHSRCSPPDIKSFIRS